MFIKDKLLDTNFYERCLKKKKKLDLDHNMMLVTAQILFLWLNYNTFKQSKLISLDSVQFLKDFVLYLSIFASFRLFVFSHIITYTSDVHDNIKSTFFRNSLSL